MWFVQLVLSFLIWLDRTLGYFLMQLDRDKCDMQIIVTTVYLYHTKTKESRF